MKGEIKLASYKSPQMNPVLRETDLFLIPSFYFLITIFNIILACTPRSAVWFPFLKNFA